MKSMLKSLMSVAVAALAFTSCSNDATDEVIAKGELKTLEVNATIDQTRTVMDATHLNLNWTDNDEIYLYIGPKATKANIIKAKTGGTIKDVTYTNGDMVYANYSLNNDKSQGVENAEINIDKAQTQSEANVFAGENLPMVASGPIENGKVNLAFKPFGCVLVFNVYGPAGNEKIKSINVVTKEANTGYKLCDLTKEPLNYNAYSSNTSATVTLTTPAAIGAAKPDDTKKGENQVYLVVAPVNYTAAKFIVTTDAGEYTFTTASGIDCSQNTARVVNLNLAKAPEFNPEIIAPTTPIEKSSEEGQFTIKNIVFKNIAAADIATADVKVYNNEALTEPFTDSWLTIDGNATSLSNGEVACKLTANEGAERTAYIGIKCAGQQAAIAITQLAPGVSADKYYVKVTKTLDDWTGDYLIVYESSDTEAYVWNLKDAAGCYITATPSTLGILSDEATDNCKVAISKSGNGYLLYATAGDNAKKYIYRDEGKNGLNFGTKSNAESYLNTITFETSYIKIESSGISFQFYKSGTSSRFRYYKTNQQKVQLYKLQ